MAKKSILGRLIGGAVAAGVAALGVAVAKQVKQDNPEGVPDKNKDGKVGVDDYAEAVKDASTKVYESTKDFVVEKAPELKEKAFELKDKAVDYVNEKAPEFKEKATNFMNEVKEKVAPEENSNEDVIKVVKDFVEEAVEKVEE